MSRKKHTSVEKVKILREYLEEKKSVSNLSEKHDLHPTQIHQWKKSLFEGALDTFSGKHKKTKNDQRINKLQEKLTRKDEVISILTEELIQLKKTSVGSFKVCLDRS